MHILASVLLALGSPTAHAGESPLPARPAEMRAICSDLAGVPWQNPNTGAEAACLFTANASAPVFCGIRRWTINGRGVRNTDAPTHWLPMDFEGANAETDSVAVFRHQGNLIESSEKTRIARMRDETTHTLALNMRVEHAYFEAAMRALGVTRGTTYRRQERTMAYSAERARQSFELLTGMSIMAPQSIPVVRDCPYVLDAALAQIEGGMRRERREERDRENVARAGAQRARAEAALRRSEADPERADYLRNWGDATFWGSYHRVLAAKVYGDQIIAARLRAADLAAREREFSRTAPRRFEEYSRLRHGWLMPEAALNQYFQTESSVGQEVAARQGWRRRGAWASVLLPIVEHPRHALDLRVHSQNWRFAGEDLAIGLRTAFTPSPDRRGRGAPTTTASEPVARLSLQQQLDRTFRAISADWERDWRQQDRDSRILQRTAEDPLRRSDPTAALREAR